MYCPSCGAPNSDDAKFCNQCGVRLASLAPVSEGAGPMPPAVGHMPTQQVPGVGTLGGAMVPNVGPAGGLPPVATGSGAIPPGAPPGAMMHGVPMTGTGPMGPMGPMDAGRIPTMGGAGNSVSLPMTGPSRRTMTLAGVAIALVGIATGAGIAYRAFRQRTQPAAPPPETNVMLIEEPHALVAQDAGAVAEPAPNPSGRRGRNGSRSGSMGNAARAGAAGGTGANAAMGAPTGNNGAGAGTNTGVGAGTTSATHATGSTASGSGSHASAGAHTTAANEAGGANGAGGNANGGGGGTETGGGAAVDPGNDIPAGPSIAGYREGDNTDATGRMDPSVFNFVQRHFASQISSCSSMASRRGDVVGTLRLRVRVGTDGHVVRTRVMNNTTGNDALATCIQNQVATWRYPQPEGGEVEFEYNWGFGQR